MSLYAAVVLCKITHQKLYDPEPQPHSLKITVFYVLLTLQKYNYHSFQHNKVIYHSLQK